MTAEQLRNHHTWRWLWAHAAQQVVEAIPLPAGYERVNIGYGWGIHRMADACALLLVHPAGEGRDGGDLALSLPGEQMIVIDRATRDYPSYLDYATAVVSRVFAQLCAEPLGVQL